MLTRTNDVVETTGTYVSTCACLVRSTFREGESAPPCPTCFERVAWEYYDLSETRRTFPAPPDRSPGPPPP